MPDVVFEIKGLQQARVGGAAMLAAYPDGVSVTGQADAEGECHLNLYRTDQDMMVLVAAEGHWPFHTTEGSNSRWTLPDFPGTREVWVIAHLI